MGLPLTVLTVALFFALRKVPSWPAQCLIPLGAGIAVTVIYASMGPPAPGDPVLIRFLIGIFIYPFLILPPVMLLQKHLRRIPALYAAFFTAFTSLCFVLTLGAMQGDIKQEDIGSVAWQSAATIIKSLVISSVVSGLVLELDRWLAGPREPRGHDANK
ncbi:MAG: hypothetical protein ABFC24_11040 [Methanoregulaceae archaeon]